MIPFFSLGISHSGWSLQLWRFVEKWNEIQLVAVGISVFFSPYSGQTVIRRKNVFIVLFFSFLFNICSLHLLVYFIVCVIFFVWYCWFYSFFLFFAILCFSCSIRFIVKWKRQNAPLVSGLWYNRHWNERRELCLPSARTMKNRLKFPLKEVQEKWYAQLLAAICQIHCICNGKERERRRKWINENGKTQVLSIIN